MLNTSEVLEKATYRKDHPEGTDMDQRVRMTLILAGILPVSASPSLNPDNHTPSYDNSKRGFEKNLDMNELAGDYLKVKPFFLAWAGQEDRGNSHDGYEMLVEAGHMDLDGGRTATSDLFFKWLDQYDIDQRNESGSSGEQIIAGHLAAGLAPKEVVELLMEDSCSFDLDRHASVEGLLAKVYRTKRKIDAGKLTA